MNLKLNRRAVNINTEVKKNPNNYFKKLVLIIIMYKQKATLKTSEDK